MTTKLPLQTSLIDRWMKIIKATFGANPIVMTEDQLMMYSQIIFDAGYDKGLADAGCEVEQ